MRSAGRGTDILDKDWTLGEDCARCDHAALRKPMKLAKPHHSSRVFPSNSESSEMFYLLVFTQFRPRNRFPLSLELLSKKGYCGMAKTLTTKPGASARPLSPHLQIYKMTITMAMSILHRITGAALFFGTALLVVFLVALSTGKGNFALVEAVYGSLIGKLVLFGYTWALFHHMLGGLRHLVWDTGAGFDRLSRFQLGWATLIGALVMTGLVWLIFFIG